MKKFTFTLSCILATFAFGQQVQVERCLSHKAIEYQDSLTPGFADIVNEQFEIAKNAPLKKTDEVYRVPVVFHIVYNNDDQNLADSVIMRQLETLNQDFMRQNPDTVNMREDFDIVKGYPNIEFRLAQIDPDGNPTTGITRTETDLESFADFSIISGSFDALERIKSTSDGGIDPWDTERYLNIWIGNLDILGFTALLGYATPPVGLPNWPAGATAGLTDGVVVQYSVVGDNNPNEVDMGQGPLDVKGRTLTHEVGHYLGLRHIWGDGDCTQQDGIDDTPNADDQSDFDCDPTKNTCEDDIFGIDLPDMIENYMDYSAETCQNSFTRGQANLMRAVLENQRIDLIEDNPASVVETESIDVQIYPNPTSNSFTIAVENDLIDQYELISLSGKTVLRGSIESVNTEVNVNSLDNGMYVLKLSNSLTNEVVSRKVVKM